MIAIELRRPLDCRATRMPLACMVAHGPYDRFRAALLGLGSQKLGAWPRSDTTAFDELMRYFEVSCLCFVARPRSHCSGRLRAEALMLRMQSCFVTNGLSIKFTLFLFRCGCVFDTTSYRPIVAVVCESPGKLLNRSYYAPSPQI